MYEFKDPTTLTRIATIAVAADLVVELLFGGLPYYFYQSLPDFDVAVADLIGQVAIANMIVLLACVIIVGCWIYRASANAHALSDDMTISPGWAVGWYFVPFANLVKPYQGMREIWMASHRLGNWRDEPTPQLLIAWWALWLITNILGNISLRVGMSDETGEMLGLTTALDVATSLLNVPLCLVLIALMRRIVRAQTSSPHEQIFA